MIKRVGNLFDTGATCIGHGVNCHGIMGAGIAKEFKRRFPDNYRAYSRRCRDKTLRPGKTFVWAEDGTTIMNMASQNRPGADATYEWLFLAAQDAAAKATALGEKVIAIPQIGCGIGGLKWHKVEVVLLAVEILSGIEFEVWKYDPTLDTAE